MSYQPLSCPWSRRWLFVYSSGVHQGYSYQRGVSFLIFNTPSTGNVISGRNTSHHNTSLIHCPQLTSLCLRRTGENESEWMGKADILAAGEARKAIPWLLRALNREPFIALTCRQYGDFNFSTEVSYRGSIRRGNAWIERLMSTMRYCREWQKRNRVYLILKYGVAGSLTTSATAVQYTPWTDTGKWISPHLPFCSQFIDCSLSWCHWHSVREHVQ